jgi:adenylate cyclase
LVYEPGPPHLHHEINKWRKIYRPKTKSKKPRWNDRWQVSSGHGGPGGPWAPVGVGINTGEAVFGYVGSSGGVMEITALGDAANVAARLASQAAAGEILLSDSTLQKAGVDASNLEKRRLELKGKSEAQDVWVMRI